MSVGRNFESALVEGGADFSKGMESKGMVLMVAGEWAVSVSDCRLGAENWNHVTQRNEELAGAFGIDTGRFTCILRACVPCPH